MSRKMALVLSVSGILATISLLPGVAFAQFPPPPMGGPPPMAGGPPPMGAGGPPPFAARPPMAPGGGSRAGFGGPGPRLGAGGPRGNSGAFAGARVSGRGPAAANSARSASVSYSRSGSYGYGGSRYGRAAYAAGAYAAGAYTGYAYGSSRNGYYSDSDCYYVYRWHRRTLVCD